MGNSGAPDDPGGAPDVPGDPLDELFDCVVVGTGLLESVVACSLARAGKKVLHLDSNEYYGHGSTSAALGEFFKKCTREFVYPIATEEEEEEVEDDRHREETKLFRDPDAYSRLVDHKAVTQDMECVSSLNLYGKKKSAQVHPSCYGYVMDKFAEVEDPTSTMEFHPVFAGYRKDHQLTSNRAHFHSRHFCIETNHRLVLATGAAVDTIISSEVGRYLDFKAMDAVFYIHEKLKASSEITESAIILDKVPASKGDIFSSNTLQALEKRCLMKVLQHTMDRGQRKEGHKGGATTLNERDLMMGRALRRPQNTPEIVVPEGNEDETSFEDYLAKHKVPPRLQDIIAHGLCLFNESIHESKSNDQIKTGEALDTLYRHVDSIGRYGTTPFITCMYGSAEIAQAFCRMCAVWGGTYILGRGISQIRCVDSDSKPGGAVSAIVDSQGREIQCASLVCNVDYLPVRKQDATSSSASNLTAGVVVTRVSVMSGRLLSEGLSVAVIPPQSLGLGNARAVHIVQLDDSASVCPDGATLLYLTTTLPSDDDVVDKSAGYVDSLKKSAAAMVETCLSRLLSVASEIEEIGYATFVTPTLDINAAKKHCMDEGGCLSGFEGAGVGGSDGTSGPNNLFLTEEKGGDLHLDETFERAKEIFSEICPDAIFMESEPVEGGPATEEEEEEEMLRSMLADAASDLPGEAESVDIEDESVRIEDGV